LACDHEETAMSDDKRPQGPDFSQGVPATDITEGKMLAGRVGDEPVLIARVDGALHAIGAECAHYHGPLAEGLIVDGAVRCPWHHACFNLRTGEAVGAPAFEPVACWAVEERDGRVFVKAKKNSAPVAKAPASTAKRVVIIGGGAGGFATAELLRREGFGGDVTLLSADRDPPYDRPNCSKDYLTGQARAEWMPLRDAAFYKQQAIDLRVNTEVLSFDPKMKTVLIKGGEVLSYDALVLATGAEPQRPPIPGFAGPDVYLLRSVQDSDALIKAMETAKRAAVIGASFIGLEVAAALRSRGLEVHVIAPESVPFEKVLGAEVGRWVMGVHQKKGVVFHLGRKVLGYADGMVSLDEGDPVAADLVVVGTGVKPRVALAESAGLRVDDGVMVDDRLRASAEGVYAVGDIARYPDKVCGKPIRVEHWVHAERQGQHVARLILGEDRPFADPPFFWSAHYESTIRYSGHAEGFDPPKVDGSIENYDATVRYEKDGKLLAVATLDRDLDTLTAEAAFEKEV
jgi:NADPH-dependent 2,4-dienoyl-CoA reductase/sulfur reductase-like enzyme/nitrite reductase/ring-hydroxylating ferredoxin subunit